MFPARAGMNRTLLRVASESRDRVFPARAGMKPKTSQRVARPCESVPRAGGDEPDEIGTVIRISTCSPRGRG